MALATYSDLQTAVANWLARSGDSTITSNVADFITLAESRIAYGSGDPEDPDASFYTRPLRIRAMETSAQILIPSYTVAATVGGTANAITLTNTTAVTSYANGNGYQFTATLSNSGPTTIKVDSLSAVSVVKGSSLSALSGGEIVKGATYNVYDDGTHLILMPGRCVTPLPTNYLAARDSWIDIDPIQDLDLCTPDQMDRDFPYKGETDTPSFYCIEGDAIRFGPIADKQYVFQLNYYQKFGALSSATNWLMTNKPDVYLWASILEAKIFLDDAQGAANALRLYKAACHGLQSSDASDRYSGATITIRSDVAPLIDG